MLCEQARLLMNAKIDNEIDNKEIEQLNAHIDSCEACTVEFEDLKYIVETMEDMELKTLPAGFEEELHEKLMKLHSSTKTSGSIPSHKSMSGFKFNRKYYSYVAAAAVLLLAVFTGPRMLNMNKNSSLEAAVSSDSFYGVEESAPAMESKSEDLNRSTLSAVPEAPSMGVNVSFTESVENSTEAYRDGRMIIQSANLVLDIEKYDEVVVQITNWVVESGGYIESHSTSLQTYYSDTDNLKQGYMTLRIPAVGYDAILNQIRNLGLVINDSSSASDVTKAYRDTASEVENLKVTEERFREILKQATAVEDILAIENELTRLRGQINSYLMQLKDWEALVDLTTVSITLNEVKNLKPVIEKMDDSLWGKAKEGFIETINQLKFNLERFIIWTISNSPIMALLLTTGAVIWIVYKRRKK